MSQHHLKMILHVTQWNTVNRSHRLTSPEDDLTCYTMEYSHSSTPVNITWRRSYMLHNGIQCTYVLRDIDARQGSDDYIFQENSHMSDCQFASARKFLSCIKFWELPRFQHLFNLHFKSTASCSLCTV